MSLKACLSCYLLCVFASLCGSAAYADTTQESLEINGARALFNYQMFCQGCHTPSGIGGNSVPDMRDHLGNFLKTQTGREYLVKVPGSANSVLPDEQLAEVLNWMLVTYSGDSLAGNWVPFAAEEVAVYRQEPLYEVIEYRRQLLSDLAEIK